MKNKLWLMAVCSTLLAAVASGQNAPAAGANTDSADTCVRKGTALINHHKPGEALKAFEQASALEPDNEQAAVGQYIIRPHGASVGRECATMLAYVRT